MWHGNQRRDIRTSPQNAGSFHLWSLLDRQLFVMVHVFVCVQMTNLLHSGTLSQVDGPCSAKAVEMILRWRQVAAVEADSSALLCIDIRIIEALHMVCFCLVILSCVGWKERMHTTLVWRFWTWLRRRLVRCRCLTKPKPHAALWCCFAKICTGRTWINARQY